MAYTEKLLPVEALFSAWQNRRQRELQDNGPAKEREQLQNQLMQQQVEAAKNANKESQMKFDYLTSPFNIQGEHWAGSGNARTPGADKFISDNMTMQKLSMLTGKNMPNQGISGGGGRGGYGRGGYDGEEQPQAAPSGMSYTGPDHSTMDGVSAASKLAELYQGAPQPNLSDPNALQGVLNDEQGNVAGMQSLINQGTARGLGDKLSGINPAEGMTPVTEAVGTAIANADAQRQNFLAGGAMPRGIAPQDELGLRTKKNELVAGEKNETAKSKAVSAAWNTMYRLPEYLAVRDDSGLVDELKSKLPSLIAYAEKRGKPLDYQLVLTNLIRDRKL